MGNLHSKVDLLNSIIGKSVYAARMKKGISREELASKVKLSQQQIEKYEKRQKQNICWFDAGVFRNFRNAIESTNRHR